MKKFLSVLLAATLVVATLVVVTIVPAAAADKGEWSVYAIKSQYLDGYADIMHDVPGYEYTEEGLKMIPSTWKDSNPYATFQTTDPVDLKEGVYLQVRVDEFTYDAGDKWFGFSIWDQQNVELGKQGDDYGYGVETLIRIVGTSANDLAKYNPEDQSTWPGAYNSLEWYKDLEEGQRIKCVNSANDKLFQNNFVEKKDADGKVVVDENGNTVYCPILTLEIVWDDASETYAISINGVPAPDSYNQAATDYFGERGDEAYIGFSLQNNTLGGTVGCTILKWGTSAEDAEVPEGDDSAAPDKYSNEKAPLADPSNIAAGAPAITLNGVRGESDVAGKPSSVLGNKIVVNEDGSVNLQASADNSANIKFVVDNDTSYAVEDFPIVIMITRNFCTCTYTDEDMDGVVDAYCKCTETANTLALIGDIVQEASQYSARSNALAYWEPYTVGDDFYHYFIFDWSTIAGVEGRINGLRIDFAGMKGTDAERNNLDICEIAFFRTAAEAEAYFAAYLEELGGKVEPGTTTTEPDTGNVTTEPDGSTDVTEPESETQTQAGSSNPGKTETTKTEKKGCGGVVGVGAIAVVAIAAAGLVSFKKKED